MRKVDILDALILYCFRQKFHNNGVKSKSKSFTYNVFIHTHTHTHTHKHTMSVAVVFLSCS